MIEAGLTRKLLMLVQGLLLLLLGMAVAELKKPFSLENSSSLVADLRRQLTASSINLLYDPMENLTGNFSTISFLVKMEKLLMESYALVISMKYPENNLSNYQNNSVQVFLTSDSVAQNALRKLSMSNELLSKFIWLLFLPLTSLEDFFSETYIPLNCRFVVVQPSGDDMTLSYVHHIARKSPLKVQNLGNWTNINWTTSSLYGGRDNLEGHTMTVTTLDYSPMLIFNESTNPTTVDGFFGQVWKNLETRMNFKSVYIKPLDMAWGSYKNGAWNGMVSLLLNGSAEVAVNAFTVTSVRLSAIDFSNTVIDTSTGVYVALRKEDRGSLDWSDYLKPFSNGLWIAVLACIVSIACYMSLLYHVALRTVVADPEPQCANPFVSVFYVFGIFCQQGHDITPSLVSCRIVYFTAYVTAVILLAAYSAGLIAFLTVVDIKLPFTNFKEMLDRGDYRLGMAPTSGVLNDFDQAKDPLLKQIYWKLIYPGVNNLPSTKTEVVRRLCSSKYAYMRSLILGVGAPTPEGCNIMSLPRASFPESLSIMFPKHSPYREIINRHLQDMKELGVLQRIALTIWPKEVNLENEEFTNVGLENVIPLLFMLALGIVASIVLLCMERFGCKAVKNVRRRCLGEMLHETTEPEAPQPFLDDEEQASTVILGASMDSRTLRRLSEAPEDLLERGSASKVASDLYAARGFGQTRYLTDEEVGLKRTSPVVEETNFSAPQNYHP
ncbi:probable glutamate receptor [Anabrus simplex]|uniref:probable glutamate receptor n=1 Tax=Anabrus simplex TaxID=316456 RepID=UPI0035A31423